MRRHGDPGQADPVIDANKVIQVTTPAGPDAQQPDVGLCGTYGRVNPWLRSTFATCSV
jgi:hypothetical protein